MTSGEGTGTTREAKPEDDLYVPPTNMNFREVGAPLPEGFVPDTPGNDKTLLRIKEGLQSQGIHTPAEDVPEGLRVPALTPSHGTPVPEVPEDELETRRTEAIEAQEKVDERQQISQSPLTISGTAPDGESGGTGTSGDQDFPNRVDEGESSEKPAGESAPNLVESQKNETDNAVEATADPNAPSWPTKS